VSDQADEFVLNRIKMQEEYMQDIEQQFDGMVRAVLPLFETEIRGVPMLKRTADLLFA
jgi:anion-transporting  ArsA/GET3 family ATPase